MTTATKVRSCKLCGTTDMPEDAHARFCEVNGCNGFDSEAYKAVARLEAAMKLAAVLVEVGATSIDAVKIMNSPARHLAERVAGLGERSDATWAMTVVLVRGNN